jgi:TonB family protein
MKRFFLITLVCLFAAAADVKAQSKIYTYDDAKNDASITRPEFAKNEYMGRVMIMNPEEQWLVNHYCQPADAKKYENVFISFVVEPNGTLSNIQVQGWDYQTKTKTTKLLPSVKREVTNNIRTMHKWTPAKKNGKAIRYRHEFHFIIHHMDFPHMDEEEAAKLDPSYVYEIAEEMPEFPGGVEAYVKWFSEHVKPHGEIGRCVVQFIVEKDGSISDPKIIRSKTPTLDAEAIRLAKAMPKWKPGKNNGKPVRVKYSLNMLFK